MTCSQCEDLFAAHVEGLLESVEERQLEEHLAGCSTCRISLDETRSLFHRLDGGVATSSIAVVTMDRIAHEQAVRLRRAGTMKRAVRISTAAALLVGLGILLSHAMRKPLIGHIEAAELSAARKQLENARTATWKTSFYQRFLGPAGTQNRWFRIQNMDQRYFFRAPGLYRCENLDGDGKVSYVVIEDVASRAKFVIDHKTKTATLTPLVESSYPRGGAFANELNVMQREDLRMLGKGDVTGRLANGFRYEFRNGPFGEYDSLDLWLDAATKRLVQYQHPGADRLDAAEVVRDRAWAISSGDALEYEGKAFKAARGRDLLTTGQIAREISFDVELDDAMFAITPPTGYAFNDVKPPPITEHDVLEFMGIVADYYDQTFPDQLPHFAQNSREDLARLSRAQQAARQKNGASPAEVKLVQSMDRWWQTGIPGPGPMHVFITQLIAERSWKYLGKGVKLGDKDRIICWYRPRGSRTYRVVYGDLSVKELEPKELPLPVGQ
jgi:Putative zinc-finger